MTRTIFAADVTRLILRPSALVVRIVTTHNVVN